MPRVLVTGGAGFIGSHTADLLLARGYEVRVLDSLQPRVHPDGKPAYVGDAIDFRQGTVASREDLRPALEGVDYVLHLAAYQDYQPDFSRFIHENAESSALLFELIVELDLPIRRIVFASSQSVAGEGTYRCPRHGVLTPGPRPVEQLERQQWELLCPHCGAELEPVLITEATCRPHTAYAISKYTIELLAESLGGRYGISTACMRYTYVQGTRNSPFNSYSGICRIFVTRVLNGLPPVCYEDGRQRRDYVNVADVARANVLAMEDPRPGNRVFNVGGGRAVTVREFAQIVIDACDSELRPEIPGIYRVGDTRHTVSDITAIGALGWRPTVPVEESVRQYVAWIREREVGTAHIERAEREMQARGVLRRAGSA